jgi:hypothetical protein
VLLDEVAVPTVTVTSTVPVPAGLVAVQLVAELQLTEVAGAVPKSTVDGSMAKPDPVMVTTVPPDAEPDVGVMLETVGPVVYVNWSAELLAEAAVPTVTVTSTVPVPAGLVAVQVVVELQLTEVPAVLPNSTVVAPAVVEKPVPVIVTTVLPAGGPDVGLMLVTASVEEAAL